MLSGLEIVGIPFRDQRDRLVERFLVDVGRDDGAAAGCEEEGARAADGAARPCIETTQNVTLTTLCMSVEKSSRCRD